jgi:hypothetical protein
VIELVPRGTRVVGLRFTEPMYQAIRLGEKTQTRRPLTTGNSELSRGDFERVDFSSGRPDGLWPVAALRARIEAENGDRRSVQIIPRIKANTALWCRRGQSGAGAKRENAEFLLQVESVAPMRLNDISDEDAIAEGILVFCPPEIRRTSTTVAALIAGAYDFQLEQMGKKYAARWRAGAIHQEVRARGEPHPRDCFALLWESINGMQSWAANPWVWRYTFRKVST